MTVTKQQFAELVLRKLDAPVSASNISKLVGWITHESGGGGGTFNPLDYVVKAPGSSAFNSAGVQNYPDLGTGVDMTVRLLKQQNTTAIRNNLVNAGPWSDFTAAVVNFNAPWTSPGWQHSVATMTEGDALKQWSTPINGAASGGDVNAVQATLLSATGPGQGIPLPDPTQLFNPLTNPLGGVVGGVLGSFSDVIGGQLSKLNPLNSVTDWLSSVLPTLLVGTVVFIGGAALIVLGAGRAVAPITRPVTDQAAAAVPFAAAAAL